MGKQIYAAEATRNPIWLLQKRRLTFDPHDFEYDSDEECYRDLDGNVIENLEDVLEPLSEFWETIQVFHSRELAEEWAKARHYDWGELGKNCRVWCDAILYDDDLAEAVAKLRDEKGFAREGR